MDCSKNVKKSTI